MRQMRTQHTRCRHDLTFPKDKDKDRGKGKHKDNDKHNTMKADTNEADGGTTYPMETLPDLPGSQNEN